MPSRKNHTANIKVLVDGAQSFGASSHGRRVGTMGDATTTSFGQALGCYGDGGAVFTNDDALADRKFNWLGGARNTIMCALVLIRALIQFKQLS